MARLPEACEVFIASLQKAEAELEYITNRLEEEFSTRYNKGKVNPMEIITRIHHLKAEIPSLAAECADVLTTKHQVAEEAKDLLVANSDLLHQLQRRAGIQSEKNENLEAFSQAVDALRQRVASEAIIDGSPLAEAR